VRCLLAVFPNRVMMPPASGGGEESDGDMAHRAKLIAALGAVIVALGLVSMPADPVRGGAESSLPGVSRNPAGQGLLHRADIYRICEEIRHCWTTRRGYRRCGPRMRCRECRFVRRCTRATGCQFREVCKWGPPVAPVPQ